MRILTAPFCMYTMHLSWMEKANLLKSPSCVCIMQAIMDPLTHLYNIAIYLHTARKVLFIFAGGCSGAICVRSRPYSRWPRALESASALSSPGAPAGTQWPSNSCCFIHTHTLQVLLLSEIPILLEQSLTAI